MTRRPNVRRREAPAPESRLLVVVATISIGIGVMAFVMGMRFGLGQNDREPTVADAGGALSRLDRQAAQLRDVRQRDQSTLSFHESLTGPARPVATLKRETIPNAPAVVAPAKSKVEPDRSKTATPSAVSPATTHLPPPPIVTVPAAPGARFSLQAGAFPDEAVAKALSARLTAKGYQVRIVPAQVEGKGTWYRVRVGSYGERATAEGDRGKLSGEGVFAIVVPES